MFDETLSSRTMDEGIGVEGLGGVSQIEGYIEKMHSHSIKLIKCYIAKVNYHCLNVYQRWLFIFHKGA